jgi:hypothetical protein
MAGHTMEEFSALLKSKGARPAAGTAELEPMRAAWGEHWRYIADREPLACWSCETLLSRPYAVADSHSSCCWCFDCAPSMPLFSGEGGREGDAVVMHSFSGVIVCARIRPTA